MFKPRQHRTPMVTRGPFLLSRDENLVAHCATADVARFLCVSANFFDRFSAAARACKGEYTNLDDPEARPGYRALVQLIDEYEKALRG